MSSPKSELRASIRSRVAALDHVSRRAASEALCGRLATLPRLAAARTVLLHLPLPSEIDVLPFGRRLLAGGVVVAVPRIGRERGELDAVVVERLPAQPMESGVDASRSSAEPASGAFTVDRFGVRTPVAGRLLPVQAIDAIIAPGLAFDASGFRLGRGGGYYDRLLAGRAARCIAVGVCFDVQIVEHVPVEPHDAPVDAVLTERRLVYTRADDAPTRS